MKDKIKAEKVRGLASKKYHGHTKFTLRNVKTGEVETYEKDNIVTLAVNNIFENNLAGVIDYKKVTPLKKMFGGLFLFEDSLNTAAIYPPSETTNKLVGHAGQHSHATASTKRGNPNGGESSEVLHGYKFVWDFATNQANGTIGAAALTHQNGGDVGLTPFDMSDNLPIFEFNTLKTIECANVTASYTPTLQSFLYNLFYYDIENDLGYRIFTNSNSWTVEESRMHITKQGINAALAEPEELRTLTASATYSGESDYGSNITATTDGTYIYVIETKSPTVHWASATRVDYVEANSEITIRKYSIETFEQVGSTLTIETHDTNNYTATNLNIGGGFARFMAPLIDGQIYMQAINNSKGPAPDYRLVMTLVGLYKFDVDDGTRTASAIALGGYQHTPTTATVGISDDFVLTGPEIINSGEKYDIVEPTNELVVGNSYRDNYQTAIPTNLKNVFLAYGACVKGSATNANNHCYLGVGYPLIYLGTVQNLETPIIKTSDKTMKVEYTITEVYE